MCIRDRANVFSEDVWIVGFLTDEEMSKFELGSEHVAVYVTVSYTQLTLPTSDLVWISGGAVFFKKKKRKIR